MMRRISCIIRSTVFALTLLPLIAGAQAPANSSASAKPLMVSGSSTVYPLLAEIGQRFQGLHPGIAVDVRPHNSGKGIAELRAQVSDIAMIARPLRDNERDLFAFPLCRDGAAIIVHRTNPVNGVNSRQLTDLLTGHITDWKQLGAQSGAVRLAWRNEGGAISELLLHRLKLKTEQIRSHATISGNSEVIKFAAGDRNAITVVALGVAEQSMKNGAPVKVLAYEGVAASSRTVRDRKYSLSRPLSLVTRGVPTGVQKQFVDYAGSGAVNDLHEKHGFVPYVE